MVQFKRKKAKTSNLPVILGGGLLFTVLVAIILGLRLLPSPKSLSSFSSKKLQVSTITPTLNRRHHVAETLSHYTPLHEKAFHWLVDVDTWLPPVNAKDPSYLWRQRYALAVFFYDTGGEFHWKNKDGWLSSTSVCDGWNQVFCDKSDDGQDVTDLHLNRNDLKGSIPTQISMLSDLRNMFLFGNGLDGSMPTQLGLLTKLTQMHLANNQLSGTIPTQLHRLKSLDQLMLGGNDLQGTICSELGELTSLTWLALGTSFFINTFFFFAFCFDIESTFFFVSKCKSSCLACSFFLLNILVNNNNNRHQSTFWDNSISVIQTNKS